MYNTYIRILWIRTCELTLRRAKWTVDIVWKSTKAKSFNFKLGYIAKVWNKNFLTVVENDLPWHFRWRKIALELVKEFFKVIYVDMRPNNTTLFMTRRKNASFQDDSSRLRLEDLLCVKKWIPKADIAFTRSRGGILGMQFSIRADKPINMRWEFSHLDNDRFNSNSLMIILEKSLLLRIIIINSPPFSQRESEISKYSRQVFTS